MSDRMMPRPYSIVSTYGAQVSDSLRGNPSLYRDLLRHVAGVIGINFNRQSPKEIVAQHMYM